MDDRIDEFMDEWVDGWMNGWMDGWGWKKEVRNEINMDEWMETMDE